LFIKNNISFLFLLIAYFVVSLSDFLFFKNYVQSNDSFVYLSLSDIYAQAQFKQAVNGYWSPLLSWFCTPFINVLDNSVWAIKLFNKIFGVLGLWAGYSFITYYTQSNWKQYLVFLFWIFMLTIYSHTETPDFISANLLLLITALLFFKNNYSYKKSLLIGFLAVLCYLSKLYNFIFVQLFIAGLLLITTQKINRIISLKFYGIQLLTFFSISFLWITVLHSKYGEWRYEYSSKFNKAIFGPDNSRIEDIEKTMINPVVKMGLMQPKKGHLYVNADEPRIYQKVNDWNMLSLKNLERSSKILVRNTKSVYYDFVLRYMFFPVILLFFFLVKEKLVKEHSKLLLLFLLAFIYMGGYFIIFYAPRYAYLLHFICFIVLAILSFKYANYNFYTRITVAFAGLLLARNLFILFANDIKNYNHRLAAYKIVPELKEAGFTGNTCIVENLIPEEVGKYESAQFDYTLINFYLKNPQFGVLNGASINKNEIKKLKQFSIHFIYAYAPETINKLLQVGFTKTKPIGKNGLTLIYGLEN